MALLSSKAEQQNRLEHWYASFTLKAKAKPGRGGEGGGGRGVVRSHKTCLRVTLASKCVMRAGRIAAQGSSGCAANYPYRAPR